MEVSTRESTTEVRRLYDELMDYCAEVFSKAEIALIEKAFLFADNAHKDMKRRSGEPFIVHPLAVSIVVAKELRLGANSIASALLHDVVEDTDATVEDILQAFNKHVARIVDGLTKISGVMVEGTTLQAENFRKILLTLVDDPRVILIKLADRLHNMRTLESLPKNKQIKISGETIYLFAPLAHRLGIYSFKTELEDLSLRFRYPKVYQDIKERIDSFEEPRFLYVEKFVQPVALQFASEKIAFEVIRRPKSIYDVWYIMQHDNVSFEEAYGLIQVNFVLEPKKTVSEKILCWQAYSIITDVYMPKPEMIRDFVTKPKANGYSALHATFMGPQGKWVDVQIRTQRMNDIAERGLAAFLDNKGSKSMPRDYELEQWLERVIEVLQDPGENTMEMIDDFRLNLFTSEILVFTPKGQAKSLPKDSTVLDFAFEIHSEVGNKAIAAKVNQKLVSLNQVLQSGDQVEILTSDKKRTSYEWLDYVKTSKATTGIRKALKADIKNKILRGKRKIEDYLKENNITLTNEALRKLFFAFKLSSKNELYGKIGAGVISMEDVNKVIQKKTKSKLIRYWGVQFSKSVGRKRGKKVQVVDELKIDKNTPFVIAENLMEKDSVYFIASCCNPIPGDEVTGVRAQEDKITIHKASCPNAVRIMSNHGDQIVSVKWASQKVLAYLARIAISAIDDTAIYKEIVLEISNELNVRISAVRLESHDGLFKGSIDVYVHDTKDLNNLILKLSKISGVEMVRRLEISEEE